MFLEGVCIVRLYAHTQAKCHRNSKSLQIPPTSQAQPWSNGCHWYSCDTYFHDLEPDERRYHDRPGIPVIPQEYVAHLVEGSPTDRTPTRTCPTIYTDITSVKQFTYILSAHLARVSVTTSLSSFFHLRMYGSEFDCLSKQ